MPIGRGWDRSNWVATRVLTHRQIRGRFARLGVAEVTWDICGAWREFLHTSSIVFTGLRVLLSCGVYRQFFLGERVQAQTTGIRVVPHPPPFDMRRGLEIAAQDSWFGGHAADYLVDAAADYDLFCRESLMFEVTSGVDRGSIPTVTQEGPSYTIPVGVPIHGASRSSAAGSRGASTSGIAGTAARPSSTQAGPSAGPSASPLSSPQYWFGDRIPVCTERVSSYIVPERDPALFPPFPEDPGVVCFSSFLLYFCLPSVF